VISAQAARDARVSARGAGTFGGLRIWWALLLSVAGGAAVYASFPPVDAWPLAAVGPGMLVVALAGRSLRGSLLCGLAFGLGLFVPLLSWLVNVAWYAWFALAVAETVIFALLTIGQRLLLRLPGWPAAVAGWWVLVEGIRDRWPFAFPWGRLAMSQSVAPDVRWVAIGGAPLLTFLVALTGAMIARAVLCCLGGDDPPHTPPALAPLRGARGCGGGDDRRGARRRAAARRPGRRRADGHDRGDPGQRAAGPEPAAAAQ
jgi:hypothetical protein